MATAPEIRCFAELDIIETAKLDGVVISAKTWNILGPNFELTLNSKYHVSRVTLADFKGLPIYSDGYEAFKVLFGKSLYSVCVVFSVPEMSVSQDDIANIEQDAIAAVKTAVNRMVGTSTWDEWRSLPAGKNGTRIFGADVTKFGRYFMDDFKRSVRNRCRSLDFFQVVVYQLGQNVSYSTVNHILNEFNLDYAYYLILHVAIDFQSEGQALIWHEEDLKRLVGKSASRRFSVAMLGNVWNLYFDDLEKSKKLNEDTTVTQAKFYNEIFKTFHRDQTRNQNAFYGPFQRLEMCSKILFPKEHFFPFVKRSDTENWQNMLDRIVTIRTAILDIGVYKTAYSTRAEYIVRLTGDMDTDDVRSLVTVAEPSSVLCRDQVRRCLRGLDCSLIRECLVNNVLPFVNTLEHIVQHRKRSAESGNLSGFQMEDYFNAAACEAVIGYLLSGNIVYRGGRYLFPKWLIQSLGLTPVIFKSEPLLSAWRFPAVQRTQGPLTRRKISFCPLRQLIGPELTFNATRLGINQCYVQVVVNLENTLVELDVDGVPNELTVEEMLNQNFLESGKIILDVLFENALHYERTKRLPKTKGGILIRLIKKFEQFGGSVEFGSTQDLVDKIFDERQATPLKFLYWFTMLHTSLLKKWGYESLILTLKHVTRDNLEDQLMFSMTPLALPVNVARNVASTMYVFPIVGTEFMRYRQMDERRRLKLQRILHSKLAIQYPDLTFDQVEFAYVSCTALSSDIKFSEILSRLDL